MSSPIARDSFASPGRPEDAVKALHQAVAAGDLDQAMELVSEKALSPAERSRMRSYLELLIELDRSSEGESGLKALNILESELDGDNARVRYELVAANGDKHVDDWCVVREDGRWRIGE